MRRSIVVLFILQVIAAIAMAFGIVEHEAAFFVTAGLVLFTVLRPVEEGLTLFIVSIPCFFALPFSESFDSMASWRILLSILFLKYLFQKISEAEMSRDGDVRKSTLEAARILFERLLHSKLFWYASAFLSWCFLSAILAPYPVVGIKKTLFLLNIFLLFPIVFSLIEKGHVSHILKTVRFALYAVLVIGFLQLSSLFFVSLEHFWRFWAGHVIPLFYGYNLGELLQTSNTWFSFGGDGPPLLRMFSVFPDSHSFAMFTMLGLAALVTAWLQRREERMASYPHTALYRGGRFLAVLMGFLALVFSGSRGVWVSAIFVAVLLGSCYGLLRRENLKWPWMQVKTLLVFFLLFGALFVPSSLISSLSQRAQGARADSLASLKRIKSITDFDEISNRSRLQIWKTAFHTIRRYPVFGVGFGNFSVALGENISASRRGASAHNLYLDIAGEAGLPGLVLFLMLLTAIVWRVGGTMFGQGQDVMPRAFATTFFVYMIWILGYSFFDVVLFNDKVLMLATILSALVYGYGREDTT